MTPEQLFAAADIPLSGSVDWGAPVPEDASGVYVITLIDPGAVLVDELHASERTRWLKGEPIIYIGRARKLSRRLAQFYRHKYGNKAPHRGGQATLLVSGAKRVHWATAADYVGAERRLIEAFVERAGQRPFGNRMSGQRTIAATRA